MLLVSRPVTAEHEDLRAGILWMLVTSAFFVSLDATAKFLIARYPAPEVVWARFVFHLLFAAMLVAPRFWVVATTRRPVLQIVRSGLLLVTTSLFFLALGQLALADASAIMFVSPILVTLLAIPLLGEKVGPRRLAAVAFGFLGALVVVRPGMGVMGLGAVFALGAAACNALYQIATRQLRGSDGPLTTLLYTAVFGSVALSFVVPALWVTPEPLHWPLFVALGAFGCAGHFTLIKAFQAAPAAVVAPFSYSSIIWATGLGFAFFGDLPDGWTLAGAAIIAGGGLYILHRERVKQVGSHNPVVNRPAPKP